jgi:predicted permease
MLLKKIWTDSSGQIPFSAALDTRVLAFNFAVAIGVGLLFSLAPALQFWRPDLMQTLKQQITTASGGQLRFRRSSVAFQMGISLLLLFGAGLFVRTLHNLKNVNVGFATDHLVLFGVEPGYAGYEISQQPQLYKRILDTLAALPGVRAAGATSDPELANDDSMNSISVPGYTPSDNERMNSEWAYISPGFFDTMQRRLIAGRNISDEDTATSQQVLVVNDAFAKRYFGGPEKAIGRSIGMGSNTKPEYQIVGVVNDSKHRNLRDSVDPGVYQPYGQAYRVLPGRKQIEGLSSLTFYVRTVEPPQQAMNTVRTAMQNLDSKLALDSLQTMDQQIDSDLTNESIVAFLSISFGVLATFLAAIGLYGVLAFSTAQRTREIGIRIALGASRASVVQMILREVLWLAGISVAVAVPAALLLTRYLRSQLFGVSSADPLALTCGIAVIAAVAMLAASLPARRAAAVNPTKALRYE